MVLTALGLVIFSVSLAIYSYCRYRFRFADPIPDANLPKVPFFGNGLSFRGVNRLKIYPVLHQAFNTKARLFKITFGPMPIICPNHPDLMQKVMLDPASMDKPYFYDFFGITQGLFGLPYDLWKAHRKVLNPTFNLRILNSFQPIFNDCVNTMMRNIKAHVKPGEPMNILEFTSPCTLSMVTRTSLGGRVLEREGTKEFCEGMESLLHQLGIRMFNANLHPDWVYRYTRIYRAEMKARNFCCAWTDKILEEKKQELAKKKEDMNNNADSKEENEDNEVSYKKPQIFIDQLLTIPLPDGRPFSDQEILDEIYTMIAAGNETSAVQSAHTILLLAMHPEIQERAVEEILRVFPTPEQNFNQDTLKQLELQERIIKESQRLMPVAFILGRAAQHDIQLDDYVCPKGTIFILNLFEMQRRKEFWGEDAHEFNPDRFLPENSKNRHPYAYAPFSAGPRSCIGSRYAMMSMKTLLTEVLRNYKLTTDIKYDEIQFKFKVSLHLAHPHRVFLEPRNLYGGSK
ncbi:cytochrome P450 4c21-like isoform X1 [Uranotaenia lowii]|uniref:cytochrome P450 4c21-like isoform X1 n=1 Tax=Uranotaenia lowii TaxID=190385 RepID=UPI0024785DF5|nr:cytochrome P450 4c21-like isoform X1 [Uranotaenia lowii]